MDEPFRVLLTDQAVRMLRRVGKKYGAKTYGILRDLIKGLAHEPDKQGEPLRGRLSGLFSLHYSRFRVIYQIRERTCEVLVVAVGHHASGSRKDIYELLERIVEQGGLQDEK